MLPRMAEVVLRARIRAPQEQVWQALSHHEGFPEFSVLKKVTLEREGSPDRDGVGAVRVMCAPGLCVTEEVVSWDPPRAYDYRLLRGAPIRDHRGRVEVSRDGDATDVKWTISFRPVIPGTGWLVSQALQRGLGGLLRGLTRRLERGRS